MNRRVLLVNPWIQDFAAYDYWMKPLGLLYLASLLRENGLEVSLIDCLDGNNPEARNYDKDNRPLPRRKPGGHGKLLRERITTPPPLRGIPKPFHRYGITPEVFRQLLQTIERPRAILIGSMMTYWYPGVFEAIRLLKECYPEVPVLLGGVYATLCREHAVAKSGADFVLTGAAVNHIEFIVKEIMNVPLSFLPLSHDPDALPYPAMDLLVNPDQLPLLTSRGCPYRCPYCASRILHGDFRSRSPRRVAEEIFFWIRTMGINNFSFYDDALLVRPEELAIPLLEEIIQRNPAVSFHCPNGLHLREITPRIASLLFRSGFRTLRFGLETADVRRQRELGGKVDNDQFEQAVAYLREAGYAAGDIAVYLLCGLPDQSALEIRESILYVLSRGARPILAEYSPIPGTALWDEARRTSPYPLESEPLFHNNSLLPCAHSTLTHAACHDLKKLSRRTIEGDVTQFIES